MVFGLRLTGDTDVVVKARADDGRAVSCVAAQAQLAKRGFPCARPDSAVWPAIDFLDNRDQAVVPAYVVETAERTRRRIRAAGLQCVLGRADFDAQNLRWHGREVWAVHDGDSLAWQPEAAPDATIDAMATGIAVLARPQPGHFDLATGYHGDLWLDLNALFLRPALLRPHVRWLAGQLGAHDIDAVCGPLDGGAFLAQAVADVLDAAFLPAYRDPAKKPAGYHLPPVTESISGWRVAVTDDAVNAGTAVRACAAELRSQAAQPVAVGALLALGPAALNVGVDLSLPFYPVETMTSQVWPADNCPLCAEGTPVTRPSF